MKKKEKQIIVCNNIVNTMKLENVSFEDISHKTGISVNTLKATADGRHLPSIYVALLLAIYFNCEVEQLFYFQVIDEYGNVREWSR